VRRSRELESARTVAEQGLNTIGAVVTRMANVLWQAEADGSITSITLCRPALSNASGTVDNLELAQIEQLWLKNVRCAESFDAIYHVRDPGSTSVRIFRLQAIPVLDARDEVRYWSGSAMEIDRFADEETQFISDAATALSSSLNRSTILNRLLQASIDRFCDVSTFHSVDEKSTLQLEGVAQRRVQNSVAVDEIEPVIRETLQSREPRIFLSGDVLRAAHMRSAIVVPLFTAGNCTGALSFFELERSAIFGARELDVATIVARQLTMAIGNIATFEREQHVTERFRFLARATEPLFATLDVPKMFSLLLDTIVGPFADYAIAASLNDGGLQPVASAGTVNSAFREESRRAMVSALNQRRSILMGTERPLWRDLSSGPLSDTVRPASWMMVPLFLGDTVYGGLICCSNSRHYDATDLELLQEIGRRASLALQHAESFARERRLTQTLQRATLPTQLAHVERASLSFVYRPAASEVQVGGDWYDSFEIDDNRVLLTVGDVMGHGLQASIVMGKLRHAINVVAIYEPNPVRILDVAERILLRRYPGSVATAFVAIVDSSRNSITYANAGHPYPVMRGNDGTLTELQADGLPIGLRSFGPAGQPVTRPLAGIDLLAFYTDGLTEATRDMLAGEKLLREALATDAALYVSSPAQFVEQYCLRQQAADDVAILVLNFVTATHWRFDSQDWRSARLARHEFVECLHGTAERESDIKGAELIFGELIANVAQHAAGPLEVALDWHGAHPVLHVIDRGKGYATGERRQEDLLVEHGRGLWLVQRLGAQLDVEILPGFGSHVRAVLPIWRA
jgi:serine phosphatase RsbU (regulator of sigma subunit)/anti-sigma regulatory factor (Ser/Thr protein kinase)